ncbi:MAG: sulfatase [Spirochaetaceae bacterium]|nr:MAG: sulfatase [Spirochaetaceae bacterium]
MRAVILMFDSLNRAYLPGYSEQALDLPNFERLLDCSVRFTNCYTGSLPCMPARRDMHTGRYNFLHRSWGPMEPFDDSVFQTLSTAGIHTHLVSDHYHYWEDGGATYHNRYSSWEIVRGQEGDHWKAHLPMPEEPDHYGKWTAYDWVNREYTRSDSTFPQTVTLESGIAFIDKNAEADNWLLQIETFDPHEPFFLPEEYQKDVNDGYQGKHFDWPPYTRVTEPPEAVEHAREMYRSLLKVCDRSLGRVLDAFDRHNLWGDTMLVVCTDHGFLLGEHGWWAKGIQPYYNELAHIPFFIHDPSGAVAPDGASTRDDLVQLIDLAPTLLSFFAVSPPSADMTGRDLRSVESQRDSVIFGMFNGHINLTDGRYVYMRAPEHKHSVPLYNYTLMPTHMRRPFPVAELRAAELHPPFRFTKGCPVLKVPAPDGMPGGERMEPQETLLFDLAADPGQERPLRDAELERQLCRTMRSHLDRHDAPAELYARFGLNDHQRAQDGS